MNEFIVAVTSFDWNAGGPADQVGDEAADMINNGISDLILDELFDYPSDS